MTPIPHKLLPPEAQALLKAAARKTFDISLNGAIKTIRTSYPKYFIQQEKLKAPQESKPAKGKK